MAVVKAPSNIWSGEAPFLLMAPHRWRVVCCFGTFGSTGVPFSWLSEARNGLSAVLPMKMSWSKWSSRCVVHQDILEFLWFSVSTGFRRIRLYTKPSNKKELALKTRIYFETAKRSSKYLIYTLNLNSVEIDKNLYKMLISRDTHFFSPSYLIFYRFIRETRNLFVILRFEPGMKRRPF